jgi:hypothetical protein
MTESSFSALLRRPSTGKAKLNGTSASIERDYLELLSARREEGEQLFFYMEIHFSPSPSACSSLLSPLRQDDNENLSFRRSLALPSYLIRTFPSASRMKEKNGENLFRSSQHSAEGSGKKHGRTLKSFIKYTACSSTKLNIPSHRHTTRQG